MKNVILRESTYNKLRTIKDKLNDILKDENLPSVSFSKTLIICLKLKKGNIIYHRPPYENSGGKKSISLNRQANNIMAQMKFEYEKAYQKMLSYDKAVFWLTQDIMSELEVNVEELAEKVDELPKGSIKRREYITNIY